MTWLWLGFFALVFAMLALDLGVFHRRAHEIRLREAMGWSIFWITLGTAFSGVVYLIYQHHWGGAGLLVGADIDGADAAVLYLTGYLLEKSLSVDNLFVISLLFYGLAVPPKYQHRLLFWGIIGALIFRCAMITGGVWLVNQFTWTFYVFGGFLVISGVRIMLSGHEDEPQPETSWFLRFIRRVLPVAQDDHGARFITRERGRLVVTHLAIALLAVEVTDIIFAVDSVPAILAVTTEPFIVITSNVFAILGLRALYFVLAGMISKFRYLKVALAILLVLIGGKMLAYQVYHLPNLASLALVISIVGAGVIASLVADARRRPGEEEM
jgi:tellurite resistance protein TerC